MRAAMVESQLRTSDVDEPLVIAAMARVPRERFVPAERVAMAYIDRPVPLGGGRALNPPLATGRLLSEAAVQPGEKVLLIGAATGYAAALLAEIGAVVTAVEAPDGPETTIADGVTLARGPLAEGSADGAPYDVLLVDGAVEELPAALVEQLGEDARIATGIVEHGVTRLCTGRKVAGTFGLVGVTDMEMVVLPGFATPERFVF
nr:protein-L-isoaspartate O-methyltransferase [Sphingobium fontiphilum]